MFEIAVCDDEKHICTQIEEILINNIRDTKIEISVFYTGEEILNALINGKFFDVIFLDIELEELDGIEIGRLIREDFNNDITQIVYISGKESYALHLFQNRPLNFLVKPLSQSKIVASALKAVELLEKSKHFFEFSFADKRCKILLKDILYFESSGRKIYVVTKSEIYEFTSKIVDVEKTLDNGTFLRIHKSFLVNYQLIKEYKYETVKLVNDVVLPISKNRRKEVRNWILAKKMKQV